MKIFRVVIQPKNDSKRDEVIVDYEPYIGYFTEYPTREQLLDQLEMSQQCRDMLTWSGLPIDGGGYRVTKECRFSDRFMGIISVESCEITQLVEVAEDEETTEVGGEAHE